MTVLLGPCRCQGCGRPVVLIKTMHGLKWLHQKRRTKPDSPDRAYWRVMKHAARTKAA